MTAALAREASPRATSQVRAFHAVEATTTQVVSWPARWAASDVLTMRDCFEVTWIDAATVPTQMVELVAVGDRTGRQFVGDPMCATGDTIDFELSVSKSVGPKPFPAAIRSADGDLLPEPIRDRSWPWWHVHHVTTYHD